MAKKALTLHMDDKIIDDFRNFCQLNALKLSAKVELLLKKEMETAHSNPTLIKLFEDIIQKQSFKSASENPKQEKIIQKTEDKDDDEYIEIKAPTNEPEENSRKKESPSEKPKPAPAHHPVQPNVDKVPSIEHLRRVKGL
ncbi:hypothetical protein KY337_03825 [Candidatus Woesearchaeota archaeon]|nr:hypothetical protein [Candidatus Woesearchaeota archaeon]